jgi:hypothetical protein
MKHMARFNLALFLAFTLCMTSTVASAQPGYSGQTPPSMNTYSPDAGMQPGGTPGASGYSGGDAPAAVSPYAPQPFMPYQAPQAAPQAAAPQAAPPVAAPMVAQPYAPQAPTVPPVMMDMTQQQPVPQPQQATAPQQAPTPPDACAAYMASYDAYTVCQDRMQKIQRMKDAQQKRQTRTAPKPAATAPATTPGAPGATAPVTAPPGTTIPQPASATPEIVKDAPSVTKSQGFGTK